MRMRCWVRPVRMTWAPAAARAWLMAKPSPLVPPVTRARTPSRSGVACAPGWSVTPPRVPRLLLCLFSGWGLGGEDLYAGVIDYDAELQRHNEVLRGALGIQAHERVLDVGCGSG